MTATHRINRIPVMMSNEELAAIDDWRFSNRIATRADAIRRLCRIGLDLRKEVPSAVEIDPANVFLVSRED